MPHNSATPISTVRKKVALTHDFISTSHHEAGHTVYGLLHFMIIYSVSIFQNKQNKRVEGFTHYDSPEIEEIKSHKLLMERLRAEIGLSYAGFVAEKYQYKLHSGSDKFPSCLDGSSDDQQEASELIKKYNLASPGRQRHNYKKRMIREVTRELRKHWDAVIVVAHALFRKKRLSFANLRSLLTTKTENKEFWKKQFKIISRYYNSNNEFDEDAFMSMILKWD